MSPAHKRPPVNIIETWPSITHFKVNDNISLPELTWWKQFNSPELNCFMIKALHENNDINVAIANMDEARHQLEAVKLGWLPSMNLLGGYTQFPIFGNPGTTIIAFPLYAINLIKQYQEQKTAKRLFLASIYAKDAAKLTLIAEVSTAYFTLLAQNEELMLDKQLLNHHRKYLKLVQSQYQHGLSPPDRIDEIRNEISGIQARIDVIGHNIVMSKNALHYLLNENPGDIHIKKTFAEIKTDNIIPGNLPATVLRHRPDVRQSEATLAAAYTNIGAVTAALLPEIHLGAFVGEGSNFSSPIRLGEAIALTPIVQFPTFAKIAASSAKYRALCFKYTETIRKALRDVYNDLSAYKAYTNQLDHLQAALNYEEKHCNLAAKRYQHGLTDDVELVRCHIRLDNLKIRISRSKLEKMTAIVTLYQDLAGGYRGI